jgi:hypothetical protein
MSNYMKTGPVEARVFHVDGQISKLTATFAILLTPLKVYRLFYRGHFNIIRAMKGAVKKIHTNKH